MLEGGLLGESFSQEVTFSLNPKYNHEINSGGTMRTKRASQTKEIAGAKALR